MLRVLFTLFAVLLTAGPAIAGESLSAWADTRAVTAGGEPSGQAGGYGVFRHGGETRGEIAQVAVLWTPRLSDNVTANVFVQAVEGRAAELGEAYFKWKPVPSSETRYAVRAGQMFVPVSLEHDGPGWTLTRTLTPSMINSWIGEEGLVDGLEGNVQTRFGGHGLGLTAGLFMGADTAGTILAFRGWTQHDDPSGTATRLILPVSLNGEGWAAVFDRQAARSRPLVEVDGRAGQYLRLDWRPPAPIAFNLVYVSNPGKPTVVKHGQYGWTTQYLDAGVSALAGGGEILGQAMSGTTKMGGVLPDGTHPADIAFESAYLLWSRSLGDGRLTVRFDAFAVKDRSLRDLDDNSERGASATLAYVRPLSMHVELTAELMQATSRHPARATRLIDPQQSQTQLQLALKFHL